LVLVYPVYAALEVKNEVHIVLYQTLLKLFLVLHFELLLNRKLDIEVLNSLGFFDLALALCHDCQLVELAVVVLYLKLGQLLILLLPKALEEWNQGRLSEALLLSIEELVLLDVFASAVDSELSLLEVSPGVRNPVYVHQGLETFTNISGDELAFA